MSNKKVPELRFKGYTQDWELCKLGEKHQIIMGQSPKSKNYTNNPNDFILVQGNSDIKNGRVFPRVWTSQVTKHVKKGTIIFSVRAPVGDVAWTDYDVVLGRGVAGIMGNDFLFNLLDKMKSDNYWDRFSTGSTFESINSNDIKNAYISIPMEDEQEKLGSFFLKLDSIITLHQRKLELLELLRKAYMQQVYPGKGINVPKLRFRGFENGWYKYKINEVLQDYVMKSTVPDEFPILSSTNSGMEIRSGRVSGSNNTGYKIINYGDLVLSPQNLWLGNININRIEKGLVSPSYKTYKLKGLNSDFFEPQLRMPFMIEKYKSVSTQGASVVRRNLDIDSFHQITIYVPNKDEQQRIGLLLKIIKNMHENYSNKINELEKLKKSYLQKMFI